MQTIKSKTRTHTAVIQPSTSIMIQQAAGELLQAGRALFGEVHNTVSPEMMIIGGALGWEDLRTKEESNPWLLEYKRELATKVLEAISALANSSVASYLSALTNRARP